MNKSPFKADDRRKIKKKRRRRRKKALTVKASTIVFTFCGCNRWERKQSYRDRK